MQPGSNLPSVSIWLTVLDETNKVKFYKEVSMNLALVRRKNS
jgi:hypothetical protein